MLSVLDGNKGKWFDFKFLLNSGEIPFRLKLKMITQGNFTKIANDCKIPTKDGEFKIDNVKVTKELQKKLIESIADWEGVKEDCNKENVTKFLETYGSAIVEYEGEEEISLSAKIQKIVNKPNHFMELEENLEPT